MRVYMLKYHGFQNELLHLRSGEVFKCTLVCRPLLLYALRLELHVYKVSCL